MANKQKFTPDARKLTIGTVQKTQGTVNFFLEEKTDYVVLRAVDEKGEPWTLLKIPNEYATAQGPAHLPEDLCLETDRDKDVVLVFH